MKGEKPDAPMDPLAMLLVAYAPAARRRWHRLCWQLDGRLGAVIRRAGDPMIAAIRLAWWDAVLVEGDVAKGGGEPLVEAWRAMAGPSAAPAAGALIDGWRTLLGEEGLSAADLADHGRKRGGGLFALLAGDAATGAGLEEAGAVWALWDLAGHAGDPALASAAMAAARALASAGAAIPRGRDWRPLRLAHDLAAADARALRVPAGGFAARHYRRLLWRALAG
jgi:phytoene synthase